MVRGNNTGHAGGASDPTTIPDAAAASRAPASPGSVGEGRRLLCASPRYAHLRPNDTDDRAAPERPTIPLDPNAASVRRHPSSGVCGRMRDHRPSGLR